MRFRLIVFKTVGIEKETVETFRQRLVIVPDKVGVNGAVAPASRGVVAAPFDFGLSLHRLEALVHQWFVVRIFSVIYQRLVNAFAAFALACSKKVNFFFS